MFHFSKTRTIRKVLLALILLFISGSGLRAQGVRLFTSADGIPSSRFISIHQDADGYIWIGNHVGLSRMIGSSITNFFETPGKDKLKSNQINAFATDSTGQLWLGTTSGLQLFYPKTEQFEHIPLNPKDFSHTGVKYPSPPISDLIALPDRNKLLVCLGIHGYSVLDVRTRKVLQNDTKAFQKALKKVVGNQMYFDSKKRLWITTANGLVLMDLKSMKIKSLFFDHKAGIYANNLEILSILEDKRTHTLLFADTKYSVLRYDEATNTIGPFSQQPSEFNNVQCLLQLKNGTILVGCDRNGIGQLDYSSKTIRNYPLLDSSFGLSECKIHQLLEDSWGNIYVCLYQKGLLVVPPFTGGFRFRPMTNGVVKQNNTAITSIVKKSKTDIFVGTDGNGVFQGADFDRMHRLSLPSSCNGNIYKILAGKDGKLWIATYGSGLFVSKYGIVESVPNQKGATNRNATCLSFDKKQERLFIGNIGNGLNELTLSTGKMRRLSFCSSRIYALHLDSRNRLWIGGAECLVYDLSSSKAHRLNLRAEKDLICYTFLEFKGQMYIGTNNGLYIYNEATNRIKHVTQGDNSVCIVAALAKSRNDQLWMSTNQGLIRFDPKQETLHVFASYEVKACGDFFTNSVLEEDDGSIVFGGDNGVVAFNPEMLEKESRDAEPIRLTTLSVNGRSVFFSLEDRLLDAALPNASRIRLSYNQNSFVIGFSVFNYAVSSKIRFKYRLEGYEENWNSTSTDRPQASYNQVPPGKYRLVIKSFNEKANLALSKKAIDIYVASPWYWSWWSKLLYVLVVAGFVLILWTMHQTRIRSRKRIRTLMGEFLSLKQNYQNLINTNNNNDLAQPQNSLDDKLKKKILQVVSENSSNALFGVEELSREVAMSRVHLYRRTKELFNCSPNDLIKSERMKKAGLLLVQRKGTVTDIAFQTGFSDSSYFARSFKSYYNMTPKAFVAKYRDNGDEDTLKELFEI